MTINFILLLISILFFQIWSFSYTLSTLHPLRDFAVAFYFYLLDALSRSKKSTDCLTQKCRVCCHEGTGQASPGSGLSDSGKPEKDSNFRNRPKSSWRFTAVTWKIRSIRGLLPVFPISPLIFSRSVFIPYAVTI